MVAYTLRRVALLVPLLFGIVVVVFGLLQIIPGDPAVVLLGQDGLVVCKSDGEPVEVARPLTSQVPLEPDLEDHRSARICLPGVVL